MKISGFIIMMILLMAACESTNLSGNLPEGTNLRVNHYKEQCQGFILQECYLVQEGDHLDSDNWSYLYEEIDGFNYEAGYIYNLKVLRTEIADPPQDASSISYTLIEILSREEQ